MTNLLPPRTYAEWVLLLDRFRDGDQEDQALLAAMQQGTLDWTNVVAERWTTQLAGALTARLKALSKDLQRGLDQSRGDTFAISQALLKAKRALAPLSGLANLPCLQEQVRSHLCSELSRWARETQESLERVARQDRTDSTRFLKLLRDHSLTLPAPSTHLSPEPLPEPGGVTRSRRVIL